MITRYEHWWSCIRVINIVHANGRQHSYITDLGDAIYNAWAAISTSYLSKSVQNKSNQMAEYFQNGEHHHHWQNISGWFLAFFKNSSSLIWISYSVLDIDRFKISLYFIEHLSLGLPWIPFPVCISSNSLVITKLLMFILTCGLRNGI